MRKYIFMLLAGFLLYSCSKDNTKPGNGNNNNNNNNQANVFSVTLSSTLNNDVTSFVLNGNLQVNSATQDIEYGFIFSSYPNPSIYQGKVIGVGKSQKSLNYTYTLTGLDTGKTYYCRAYALLNGTPVYSPIVLAGKVAPYIMDVQTNNSDTTANPTQITISTNLKNLSSSDQISIIMDGQLYQITSKTTKNNGISFVITYPGAVTVGKHNIVLKFNNINLNFTKNISPPPGEWTKLSQVMSYTQDLFYQTTVGFVKDNWIYSYRYYPQNYPVQASTQFFKENIYTGEVIQLSLYDANAHFVYAPTIVMTGNEVHFIGGAENDLYSGACVNWHYIYNFDSDTWRREADFPGTVRKGGVAAVYNNKIYYGMGFNLPNYNNPNSSETERSDMWSYDLQTKQWTQLLTSFPDGARMHTGYFSIGSKIYMVGGYDRFVSEQSTWCYDAQTNAWTRKADFPGAGFEDPSGFQLGQYGYIGWGTEGPYDSYYGPTVAPDFFRYDPAADKWVAIGNLPYSVQYPIHGTNGKYLIAAGGFTAYTGHTDIYKYTP